MDSTNDDNGPRFADGSFVDFPNELMLISVSPAMQQVMALAARVARTPSSSALIVGESGVGKELVSSFIHQSSARRHEPHVKINMAAFPEHMIEAELFGSVRGAFTDAHRDRAGLFASADGGTILLDELCELDVSLQPKLLRVLEERRYFPVGSDRERRTDVRVVAATNRNPEDEVAAGRLRADLYYRLSSVIIRVPPLRERCLDILPLARHFLQHFAQEFSVPVPTLSRAAELALLSHTWPGNVRELRNVIERAVMLTDDRAVDVERLGPLTSASGAPVPATAKPASVTTLNLKEARAHALENIEREHIERVMDLAGGSPTRAAQMLGLSRSTLWEKLRRYGLANDPR